MTPILKVLADYCAVYVNDDRLKELSETNPPLYAQKMWSYLNAGLPFFTHPMWELDRLTGDGKLKEPQFASYLHTETEEHTEPFTITLPYTEFEVCSCHLRKFVKGQVILQTINAEYDAETGEVTLPPLPAESQLDFDLYTDGYFAEKLSVQEMKILGLCFDLAWESRFDQDWLSRVSKVEDKSFFEQNRANKQNADTARFTQVLSLLAQEMQKYENSLYYRKYK
ncbi:MAG: hypothetical protein KBS59_04055 [Clostridiales bacterium]|nr:hypothetical protein [Clostridiales bacterium]